MEATLFDCYICKAEKTTGVCQSCLTTLPSIGNIKTETTDCGCIEEICSCLETSWSLPRYPSTPQFQAEILDDPALGSEAIVKITPKTPSDEMIISDLFNRWLLQIISFFANNE